MPALWVYKCNRSADAQGDWNYFFDECGGDSSWGDTECILNASSQKILREEMQVGDLVLAWQSDAKAAVGLCRVSALEHDGDYVALSLETVERFVVPVKLLEWKERSKILAQGKAFAQGNAATLHRTTRPEAEEILWICRVLVPLAEPAS